MLQTDPVQWVNQDSQAIKDLHTIEDEIGASSELGVFVQSATTCSPTRSSRFMHDFANSSQLGPKRPEGSCSPATSIVTTVSYLTELPGATDIRADGRRGEGGVRRGARPTSSARPSAPTARRSNLIFLTGPGSLEDRAQMVDDIRDDGRRRRPRASRPRRRASPSSASACSRTSRRTGPAHLPRDRRSCSCSSPCGCAAIVRALLSLVPVLIAVGMASLVAYASASS